MVKTNMKAFLYAAVLGVGLFSLWSCVSPGEYFARATTKPDADTPPPAVTLATNVPTVAGNPGDFNAWIEIAKAIGYIVVGASAKPVAGKTLKAVKQAVA